MNPGHQTLIAKGHSGCIRRRGSGSKAPDHSFLRTMNKPAVFLLIALGLALNSGCEQQSYEETKMFNQSSKPGGHGHDASAGHDGATGPPGDHAAPQP